MTEQASPPRILILAGPNGAGKTTFAREYLPQEGECLQFINADLIAEGLSPFAPEAAAIAAGKIMLAEMNRLAAAEQSFAFETTLSGRAYARLIPQWRERGFRVQLHFLALQHVALAIERVAQRVAQGGHAIAEPVIRRRYQAGWSNLHNIYKALVDEWAVYDNSGEAPRLIERGSSHVSN